MFNVSACTWKEGAEENIVTITSKDSNSGTSGDSSSGGSSRLSRGAIAGIVVASVVAGILIVLGFTLLILRKRRKWMKAGFAVGASTPEPSESVLDGPVFNSAPQSTTNNSTPPFAVDTSTPRSTAECSRSAADSPIRPVTVGENVELDGQDTVIRPSVELDGKEIHNNHKLAGGFMSPVAEHPNIYEIPPDENAPAKRESKPDGMPFREKNIPSHGNGGDGNTVPPSPLVSTFDTTRSQDEEADPELVSPTTPTRNGPRPF